MTALLALFLAAGSSPVTQEAERLAAHALTAPSPEAGVTEARKALAMTEDFEPTEFVKAGRKGEVVEDAYLAAREEYRHHRAKLYAALGRCLLKARRGQDAARYLGRAVLLDASGGSLPELSSALLAAGKGRAALLLLGRPEIHPTPEALEAAAD